MSTVEKMLVARMTLQYARALLAESGVTTIGVTLLVHDAELEPGSIEIASLTTLPDRAAQRVVMAEALFRSLMADGVDPGQVARHVSSDLAAFEAKRKAGRSS